MKEAQEAKRPAKSPTAVVEQTSELGSVQIHDNVTTGIFAEIQGTDVEIPCLLMGVGGRHGIFVRIK